MTKETLLKQKAVWEDRKKQGDPQADFKISKIDKTLAKMSPQSSKPNVLDELASKKAKK